jgi:hypothetical protein
MSFVMQKIRVACRDFIGIAKSAGEELKNAIRSGPDYTIIEIEAMQQSIDKVVQFLQHPGFNPEIWRTIESVMDLFDKRTGLTELAYGMSARQMRSAQEANVKSDAIQVRPDDMANQVEDAMSLVSKKEAFAAHWHLKGQDVAPILGQVGGMMWDQWVAQAPPETVLYQLDYRIEAGSARKPNKATEVANMEEAMKNLAQPLFQIASLGQPGAFNALITAWAKSIDLDATPFLINAPPPPPPGPPPGDEKEPPPS